jgi:hypothetical protein
VVISAHEDVRTFGEARQVLDPPQVVATTADL